MATRLSKTKRTNSRIQTEIRTIHSNDNKPQRRHVSCKLSGLKPVLCARNFLLISAPSQKTNEPPHDKTNKMICAFSEHSDQPGHLPSLIGVFAVRMKKAWVHSCPLSAQRRLIRLGGCPGWSESSLGAHAISLVLSWGGSNKPRFNTEMKQRWGLDSKTNTETLEEKESTGWTWIGSTKTESIRRQLNLTFVSRNLHNVWGLICQRAIKRKSKLFTVTESFYDECLLVFSWNNQKIIPPNFPKFIH